MAALVLSGIAASKGIAIGRARVIVAGSPEVPEYVLSSEQVPAEIVSPTALVTADNAQQAIDAFPAPFEEFDNPLAGS